MVTSIAFNRIWGRFVNDKHYQVLHEEVVSVVCLQYFGLDTTQNIEDKVLLPPDKEAEVLYLYSHFYHQFLALILITQESGLANWHSMTSSFILFISRWVGYPSMVFGSELLCYHSNDINYKKIGKSQNICGNLT